GTPPPSAIGSYPLTLTARSSSGPDATVPFTLGVAGFTSPSTATFYQDRTASFTITAAGAPGAQIRVEGCCPTNGGLEYNADGSVTISGIAPLRGRSELHLFLDDVDAAGRRAVATQTLTVSSLPAAPVFSSADTAYFRPSSPG